MSKDETTTENANDVLLEKMEQRFAAIEARMQKIAGDHAKREASKLEKLVAELAEKTSAQPAPEAQPDSTKIESHPMFLEMKKQATLHQAALEKLTKQVESERREKLDMAAISQIKSAAGKFGVRPALAEALTAHLYESKSARMRYNEDGSLVFRNADGLDVDPEAGLAEFFKSDHGKEWVAPVDAAGSGATKPRPNQTTQSGQTFSPSDAVAALFGNNG